MEILRKVDHSMEMLCDRTCSSTILHLLMINLVKKLHCAEQCAMDSAGRDCSSFERGTASHVRPKTSVYSSYSFFIKHQILVTT